MLLRTAVYVENTIRPRWMIEQQSCISQGTHPLSIPSQKPGPAFDLMTIHGVRCCCPRASGKYGRGAMPEIPGAGYVPFRPFRIFLDRSIIVQW